MLQFWQGGQKGMINWMDYGNIQKLKREGLNKSQVSRKLEIDYKTVLKYWNMSPDDFSAERSLAEVRSSKIDTFKEYILKCLREYPDMSTAQLYDWIKEKTGRDTLPFAERTMRSYVKRLRAEYDIAKPKKIRQYEAVPETEPGYQAQVDMGSTNLKTYEGKSKKVYCFAMVLSYSRYKYVYWQDRPFNTDDFIAAHIRAFNYFGGKPIEIVYDQDRVMTVSENYGDIIFTAGFQNFIDEAKFKVFLCRGSDPESKGKVENVVKYAKHNFADHRVFYDIESFNSDCLDWLRRTANGTENETTKKIPAEAFNVEKEYLLPASEFTFVNSDTKSILYLVRKDNVVLYKSNRYRVPKGTYHPGKQVALQVQNGELFIIDPETGEVIATHTISLEKGRIIGERTKHEEVGSVTKELEYEVIKRLENMARLDDYLEGIKDTHPRHYKDQLYQILKLFDEHDISIIKEGFDYCMFNGLYSFSELKSAILFIETKEKQPLRKKINAQGIPIKYHGFNPQVRNLSAYEDAFTKGC